jgi:ankyrin repeat protein
MLAHTVNARNAMEIINDIRQDGDSKCVEVLERFKTSKLTKKEAKRAKDENDFTLLHYVMLYGRGKGVLKLVKYLVYLHPDSVKATTKMGNLAIHLMPQYDENPANRSKIESDQLAARLFLIRKKSTGLRALDSDGVMPLFRAILLGYNITARAIVETLPEAAKLQNSHGHIPLHLSLDMPYVDASLVEALVYSNPAGFRFLDNAGKSPLGICLLRGNDETLEWKKQIIATVAKAACLPSSTGGRRPVLWSIPSLLG